MKEEEKGEMDLVRFCRPALQATEQLFHSDHSDQMQSLGTTTINGSLNADPPNRKRAFSLKKESKGTRKKEEGGGRRRDGGKPKALVACTR